MLLYVHRKILEHNNTATEGALAHADNIRLANTGRLMTDDVEGM